MVVLRATQKVLRSLEPASEDIVSDTALGDWYVNRVIIDRQPLLLLVSSMSLLAILEPARDVKTLPARLADLVAGRLRRLGADSTAINLETIAMKEVRVGRTRDRSVTGTMVDFAKALPYYLPAGGWGAEELRLTEERLSETPCRCGHPDKTVWPRVTTLRLLLERYPSLSVVR